MSILPHYVDPRKLAVQSIVLEGQIAPELCARLAESVVEVVTSVSVVLAFAVNEQGRRGVTGEASTEVSVVCQRCLEPVTISIQTKLALTIVWTDEEARSLPKDVDAWLVDGENANLIDLIEDELLLALPIVSLHDDDECQVREGLTSAIEPETSVKERPNPFEILGQLKH